MLRFAECEQCHESHALRADGRMSIHQTAAGERCAPVPIELPESRRPSRRERQLSERELRRRRVEVIADPEREAAFAYAAERKRRRPQDQDTSFDRRIYAVGGAHVVRGGLPTLGGGRRHR